jgi:hypothetical protein
MVAARINFVLRARKTFLRTRKTLLRARSSRPSPKEICVTSKEICAASKEIYATSKEICATSKEICATSKDDSCYVEGWVVVRRRRSVLRRRTGCCPSKDDSSFDGVWRGYGQKKPRRVSTPCGAVVFGGVARLKGRAAADKVGRHQVATAMMAYNRPLRTTSWPNRARTSRS